ncbi:MAG: S8 family peptidase, partial [Cyclonatronaceae bacterium]
MYSPTNRILVKFTEQVVTMPDPEATVSLDAITDRSAVMRSYLQSLDTGSRITRYRPQFQVSDTARVNRHGQIIRSSDWSLVYRIQFDDLVPFYDVKEELERYEFVEWVDPPVMIQSLAMPNDYSKELNQWNLDIVSAKLVWDITTGSSAIRIQILDDGIEFHNDIDNKVVNAFGNPVNGLHGLSVAGVAGAETDNNLGLASLGWETSLVTAPVDWSSTSFEFDVAGYVLDSFEDDSGYEAEIINCSFRTLNCLDYPACTQFEVYDFQSIRNAVAQALDEGIIIVAAAGNISDEVATVPYTTWPAAYEGVIAVSASNSSDQFPNGYNYGNFVSLSAPAISVPTLGASNGYTNVNGTSFAAPHVSATVALMLDINPSLTPTQVKTILQNTADKVGQYSYDGNGWNQYMGHGRLNAYEAVKHALPNQLNSPFFAVWPSQ